MVELSAVGSRGKRMSGKKTPAMDESERAAQRQVNGLESIFSFFFSFLFVLPFHHTQNSRWSGSVTGDTSKRSLNDQT